VAAKRTRCRTSEIAGWAGVVVARRADTLTHTPLRLMNPPRLTARLFSSGWRAGTALRSGDMPPRLPWRHLAATGGMMRSAFSECAKTTHSGSLPGSHGREVGLVCTPSLRESADTASLSCARFPESRRTSATCLGEAEGGDGSTVHGRPPVGGVPPSPEGLWRTQ